MARNSEALKLCKDKNVALISTGDAGIYGMAGLILELRTDEEVEIIPGITSAVAVPASAGIPVTHRGITTSFRVVTGHENPKKKISQIEWETFLNDETIIFLMGYHNIEIISSKLLSLGKRKDYPCAVISKGTTTEQKVVVGTLEDIVEKSKDLPTPVMIVIGEVVNLREQINWFN